MDGEADAAREYERLRAELADFVVDALAQRMAAGEQPELSQALIEAIDRRVDQAVSARLAQAEWPDPDAFADSVIAAAAGRSDGAGDGDRARSRRSDEDRYARSHRDSPKAKMTAGRIGLIALIGILVIAAATYFLLRGWSSPASNTVVMNVQTNSIEPTPDGSANALQPPGNAAAPTSAGTAQNVQGQIP
ncbi:MAG TPA: hypothetical protein VGB54_02085 [Allosphingosinicella sp.]